MARGFIFYLNGFIGDHSMNIQQAWMQFYHSGKIEDYLQYRKQMDAEASKGKFDEHQNRGIYFEPEEISGAGTISDHSDSQAWYS